MAATMGGQGREALLALAKWQTLCGMLAGLAWVPVAVCVHRAVGAPPEASAPRLAFDRRSLRYIWTLIKIGLMFVLPFLLVAIPGAFMMPELAKVLPYWSFAAISVFFGLAAALAVARFSLALPAAALDRDASVLAAWDVGKGNTLRLTLVAMVPALVPGIAVGFALAPFVLVLEKALGLPGQLMVATVRAAVETAAVLLGIVPLSLSYLYLTSPEASGQAALVEQIEAQVGTPVGSPGS
ncbi:MAG: hypothetical protein JNK11_16720 [Alphaproteobacteria bacterium]|nr:hypothetical protein [Alphaproteobacteria bacterium]